MALGTAGPARARVCGDGRAALPGAQIRARSRQLVYPRRRRGPVRLAAPAGDQAGVTDAPGSVTAFEPHRAFLSGLAYRMLGSVAEAEDVVQDAFLRWREVDRAAIAEPRAYLARVVSRLCLDRLKSARQRARSTSAPGCPSRSSPSPRRRSPMIFGRVAARARAPVAPRARGVPAPRRLRHGLRRPSPRRSTTAKPPVASSRPARASTSATTGRATRRTTPRARARGRVRHRGGDGRPGRPGPAARGGRRHLFRRRRQAARGPEPIVGKDKILRFYQGLRAKGAVLSGPARSGRRSTACRASCSTRPRGPKPWRWRPRTAPSWRSTRYAIPTRSGICPSGPQILS